MSNLLTIEHQLDDAARSLFSDEACELIAEMVTIFAPRMQSLMSERADRLREIGTGPRPDFAADTEDIREAEWQIGETPTQLLGSQVVVIGPPNLTAIGNAFAAGADGFVADFAACLGDGWQQMIDAQLDLRTFIDTQRHDQANTTKPQSLWLRPRALDVFTEKVSLNGEAIPAALLDVVLYAFHNAKALISSGQGLYLSLPKIASHAEAELWRDIFERLSRAELVERSELKATVLLATLPAAFEADEILYELREFVVGLAYDRTDYVFSYAQYFHQLPGFVLPDRADVFMGAHFLESFNRLLVQTCQRRGALAIGDTSNLVITSDDDLNEIATNRFRNDREREFSLGFDVFTVPQPDLVATARQVLNQSGAHVDSRSWSSPDTAVHTDDLLQACRGKITRAGVKLCINDVLRFIVAGLTGKNIVQIGYRLVRQSSAELSRTQLWQWLHHDTGILDEGINIDDDLFCTLLDEEISLISAESGADHSIAEFLPAAGVILKSLVRAEHFPPVMSYDLPQDEL